MTQAASFKGKFKQGLSMFKWDLKSCSGTLIVYGILAVVALIIVLTVCLVFSGNSDISYNLYDSEGNLLTGAALQRELFVSAIKNFQDGAMVIIGLLTVVFTIFYTIKIFSYLHNKRKADMYGSLPISRITLYLSKLVTAFVLSAVPAAVLLGIVALAAACCGVSVTVGMMILQIVIGSLACITAYGLVAVCCGTTFNTVVMYLAVCISYPITMNLVAGTISSFFYGSNPDAIFNTVFINALNPIAAYDGENIIYWLIFTAACVVGAMALVRKRRAERAQSSFAYYLPCHLVKVLVSFLMGMFLGIVFGSMNVFGNGLLGFIFGFVLLSVPTFIIAHLIFYKGFSGLVRTLPYLAALVIIGVGGMTLVAFDVTGYNKYLPSVDSIQSAGFYDASKVYVDSEDDVAGLIKSMSGDFTDEESKQAIIDMHAQILDNIYKDSSTEMSEKFVGVFGNMIMSDTLDELYGNSYGYGFSYTLNNGMTVTRIYTMNFSSAFFGGVSPIDLDDASITASPLYVEKYSGTMVAPDEDMNETVVVGSNSDGDTVTYDILASPYYNNGKVTAEQKEDAQKLREAFIEDFKANPDDIEKVMTSQKYWGSDSYYSYYDISNGYFGDVYDEDYLNYCGEEFEKAKDKYPDIVCEISFAFELPAKSENPWATENTKVEIFCIPESYTNTLRVLREQGVLTVQNEIAGGTVVDSYDYYEDYDEDMDGEMI